MVGGFVYPMVSNLITNNGLSSVVEAREIWVGHGSIFRTNDAGDDILSMEHLSSGVSVVVKEEFSKHNFAMEVDEEVHSISQIVVVIEPTEPEVSSISATGLNSRREFLRPGWWGGSSQGSNQEKSDNKENLHWYDDTHK
jgi:hypothetical protein